MHLERIIVEKKTAKALFLRGKNVLLRPLNKETDVDTLTRWINDQDVQQYVLVCFPMMRERELLWLEKMAKDESLPEHIILAIETAEGRFIGTMGLHSINWKDKVATTGTLIGEKDCWGKGYGTEAKMLLLGYAFNALGMHKICSRVIDYNKRSLRYSLRCGYKIEGRLRKHVFKKGAYRDEFELGIFREEWLEAKRKMEKKSKRRCK